jgi:hypothetical protein
MSSDMLDPIQCRYAQAGMLMEDGSAAAIVIGDADDPLLMLERLRDDMRRLLLKVTLSLAAVLLLADPGSLSNACHQPQNVIYLLLR